MQQRLVPSGGALDLIGLRRAGVSTASAFDAAQKVRDEAAAGQRTFVVVPHIDPLGSEDFGFIFPKGSDLVAPVNAAIAALKADGTIDALNKKWFLDYKFGE